MTKTALITGASAGLGKEFARYHASKGGHLILTARREEELQALAEELTAKYKVKVDVFALDLASQTGADTLFDLVIKNELKVDILINNAGFGGHGKHYQRPLDQELFMIDLNVKALVTLTHRFANDMISRGGGKILNVGSTAGFAPGPNQAVYFATKAFVNSFSQAVDHEMRSKGVRCTVLAPGYVETEFAQVADLEGTNMVNAGGASAADVAKHGYDAMERGELLTINDKKLDVLMNWVVPLLPRRLTLKMVGDTQSK